jgi:amino acid adenylation domain-containing protein/FkbM family methyltransferase/non-ribosomal peptide synthase protein (TIGR01720 family)
MSVSLLADILGSGLTFWAEDDKLRFRAPQGAMTPSLRQRLAEKKDELLLSIEEHKKYSCTSFAQQRQWLLHQLETDLTAYNIFSVLRLNGALDIVVLERCFGEVIQRHESLRTTFQIIDGLPVQVISPTPNLPLSIIDLRRVSETERRAESHRLAIDEAWRPFDLSSGPLLRMHLIRLAEEEAVLFLTMHHIISDAWSSGVFIRELVAFYGACSQGRPAALPALSIQYADFAQWQRIWLKGKILDDLLAYWKSQLEGAPAMLELPTDYPRPAVQTYRGAVQRVTLSIDLTKELKLLSHRENGTLFMTLLAAFKILLQRYSGQTDIVVGSPIANRNRAEVENLIGLFLNTLVLRTNLSGDLTFRDLLGRLREVALDAYEHQDLPFEKLVEELEPERDLSRNPLFQVLFVLQNAPKSSVDFADFSVTPLEIDTGVAMVDLTLEMTENEGGELVGVMQYNTDLFRTETIVCMLRQFEALLEQITDAPDMPIQAYSLVTPESQDLLPDPTQELCEPMYELVTEMVAAWVDRAPERIALVQGECAWTYGELIATAQAQARALLAQGLEKGDGVAVLGPRSFGLISAILAVFLSGGVLLTVDQKLPIHRKQVMLKEAKVEWALYIGKRSSEDEWLWESSRIRVMHVDQHTAAVLQIVQENTKDMVLPKLSLDDPAYIFFTSGTTGVPKGILGVHKGLGHFLTWQRERFAVGPQDRTAQLTGLSFDAVLRDIFLSLASGATLCLPQDAEDLGTEQIMHWLDREQITVLHLVPALGRAWLNGVPLDVSLQTLRWIFFAGEPLLDSLVRQWREAFPKAGKIVNLYGATETTMIKCFYIVPDEPLPGVQALGQPLPQTQALILADNNRLCGIGEPGEIILRTPFRTCGYINAPEESHSRFAKNPFREDDSDLFYYTGDRGRYRHDGVLEFLGRVDDQVKIRGVRVEPKEVETVLGTHSDISEVAVMTQADKFGEKQLVAYIVSKKKRSPWVAGHRRYILPNNMAIVHLNKNETDYLYRVIFERLTYLGPGITIEDGDCIFDVGANIGLFALFVNQVCPSARLFCFEPNPKVLDLLRINTSLYGDGARLCDFGLSDAEGMADLTHFPGFSILSGFYADPEEDKEVVKKYMFSQEQMGLADVGELAEHADDVLEGRFDPQIFTARLRTVSNVIQEQGIESIDLLKINAEKSELDVLKGIEPDDWKRVKQIVAEVHASETLEAILELLVREGYVYTVEQDPLLEDTDVCWVYATRQANSDALRVRMNVTPPVLRDPFISAGELRHFASDRLPAYLVPSAFVFLEALPLTSNGKVDRRALPMPDESRENMAVEFVAPRTAAEKVLAQIWAEVLDLERVGIRDNFFDLGGDSLLGIRGISKANQAGINLTYKQLFQHQTIAELAAVADTTSILADQGVVTGPVPLTPVQHWFFDKDLSKPGYYNEMTLIQIHHPMDAAFLEESVKQLVIHHDALRLRFTRNDAGWQQINAAPGDRVPFTIVDLSAISEAARMPVIEATMTHTQMGLDLAEGPLIQVVFFESDPDKPCYLAVALHCLVADALSTRFLLEDLRMVYEQLIAGREIKLPRKTTSFGQWAERLVEYAQAPRVQQELNYWTSEPRAKASGLPVDYHGGDNTIKLTDSVMASLSLEETRLWLQDVPRKCSYQANHLLIAALAKALYQWAGQHSFLLDVVGHGREALFDDVDLSHSVGWFATIYPVLLDCGREADWRQELDLIKGQLEEVPNNGVHYGLLRYLSDDTRIGDELRALPQADAVLNYVGGQIRSDDSELSQFQLIGSAEGWELDSRAGRKYLLEIGAKTIWGQLQMRWVYSRGLYKALTIEQLAQNTLDTLRFYVNHCLSSEGDSTL